MNLPTRLLPLLLCTLPAIGQDRLVRETEALSPDQELAAFTLAEGFEVRLFAAEPMINKPINLAVDGRGRLWVSSTVEYPYAAAKERWTDPQGTRVEGSRDAIKILEDTDGDGRADRVTDFADGLNIPTGVLPWRRPGITTDASPGASRTSGISPTPTATDAPTSAKSSSDPSGMKKTPTA